MVKTNFVPSRDGFHFPNKFTNNVKIIGSLSVTTYGRCGGMAWASLDYYTRGVPTPTCNGADFGTAQVPTDGTPLADYIYTRLMDTFVKYGVTFVYKNYESDHATLLAGKGLVRETKEDEWPLLKSYLDQGKPVVLGLIACSGGLADCHQVVACGYEINNGIISINIYDNNYPDDDTVAIQSTVDISANPHWNEVNSNAQITIWRGFFVESECNKDPNLTMPVDLFISRGIDTNASRVCVGDSLTCTFAVKNFGTYNAHFRFAHICFEKLATSSSPHPAQAAELPYDKSAPITLAPNQEITIAKTYPKMGPIGQYLVELKFLPGTQTLSSVTMLPNIWTGAKPVTQIEVINPVALYVDTYGQKQVLLYSTVAQAPLPASRIISSAKPTLVQPAISRTVPATLAKDMAVLDRINVLRKQMRVDGGAYHLGMMAYTTGSQLKSPITYSWKIDAATSVQQTATGNPLEFTVQVGKTGGPYSYDHAVEVTATDATGAMAKDSFMLKLPPPSGTVYASYDDTRNVTGVSQALPFRTGSTKAYAKLVISAETQGIFGQCTYKWQPLTSSTGTSLNPQILDDGSKALYTWPLSGGASNFDSYQNQTVKVTVKDEIGQTITLQAEIANPLSSHKEPVDQSSLPVLQAQFDDPRKWVVINELAITSVDARTQVSIPITKDTMMKVQSVPRVQLLRVTYGQKTVTK